MAYAVRDQGLAMVGFQQLNAALQRIGGGRADYGLAYELQRRLRIVGDTIARSAPSFITHRTGRHGDVANPTLEESVRTSVTQRSASVYSTALHGGVQNVGGKVGRNHATILKRAEVSRWMIQAVTTNRAFVEGELDGLLDWLTAEFEAG
jgi:phage gpG-like protein